MKRSRNVAFYQINTKNYINGFGRNVVNTWGELPATQTRLLRKKVEQRDGYKCRFCNSKNRLQVDHIIPIKAGGPVSDINNIQLLCEKCYNEKKTEVDMLFKVVYSPRALTGTGRKRHHGM